MLIKYIMYGYIFFIKPPAGLSDGGAFVSKSAAKLRPDLRSLINCNGFALARKLALRAQTMLALLLQNQTFIAHCDKVGILFKKNRLCVVSNHCLRHSFKAGSCLSKASYPAWVEQLQMINERSSACGFLLGRSQ